MPFERVGTPFSIPFLPTGAKPARQQFGQLSGEFRTQLIPKADPIRYCCIFLNHRRNPWFWIAASVLVFIFLSTGTALTKRPWCDEAWFASPALDLVVNGRMGTQLLEPTGSFVSVQHPGVKLDRIDQRTYWVMPLYLLVSAAWFKAFGFSLTVMRLAAVAWGLVALAAWYVIVRRLGGSRGLATLAVFFIGIDSGFEDSASDGRMDMMCAALGFVALAAYLSLRESSFRLAVLASQAAAALSCFTHPNGAMASVTLLFLMLYLDRKQFACILQDPAAFRAQFSANSLGRSMGLMAPIEGVWLEIKVRYLEAHFLPADGGAFGGIKVLVLAAYILALILMIALPPLRRTPGARLLLYLTGLRFLLMGVGLSFKYESYLVHILPFYAAILAWSMSWLWKQTGQTRWIVAMVLCTAIGVQSIWNLHRIFRFHPYQTKYQPALSFLKAHMTPKDFVYGSAELGFLFGFYNRQLVNDLLLGRWTGRQPTLSIVDKWRYYRNLISAKQAPEYTDYVTGLLQKNYHTIYAQDEGYQILALNQGRP